MSKAAREFPWPTMGGYDFYEVLSAMQKSIRRGLEEDALFWGTELYLSDYADHAWSRLLIISSEDVGFAEPLATVTIKALHDLYCIRKQENPGCTLSTPYCSWFAPRNPGSCATRRSPALRSLGSRENSPTEANCNSPIAQPSPQ
jgi:hypothetical protein